MGEGAMASTALDLGLRGVAVGLFLVICAVLLRYGRTLVLASIGFALMAAAQIPKGWRAASWQDAAGC
jgi:hypothetical protein